MLLLESVADIHALVDKRANPLPVEVRIGDGRKEPVCDKTPCFSVRFVSRLANNRDSPQYVKQEVLKVGCFLVFATHSFVFASNISGSFLTLITKHAHFTLLQLFV